MPTVQIRFQDNVISQTNTVNYLDVKVDTKAELRLTHRKCTYQGQPSDVRAISDTCQNSKFEPQEHGIHNNDNHHVCIAHKFASNNHAIEETSNHTKQILEIDKHYTI